MAVRLSSGWTVLRSKSEIALCIYLLLTTGNTLASNNYLDYTPFETRDQNLLNLIHGQALPTNARLLDDSSRQFNHGLFSSSLVITNTLNIENINSASHKENIYLDYEAYRFNFSYQHAVNKTWNLKLDIPVIHQSGGFFDSAIDKWHQFWGLPSGNRPLVEDNIYDIQYDFQSQASISLNEGSTTLGDIQIAIARTLIDNNKTAVSAWFALKLPTGSEDKLSGNGATDFSAWLALNQQLSRNWLVNANGGVVFTGEDNYKNIPLSDHVFYGHIMFAWLISENINLKLQLQGHTSYYDQSQLNALSDTYFLTFGGSYNISSCQQIDFAFSEDIKVEASPDASMIISWRSFIGC